MFSPTYPRWTEQQHAGSFAPNNEAQTRSFTQRKDCVMINIAQLKTYAGAINIYSGRSNLGDLPSHAITNSCNLPLLIKFIITKINAMYKSTTILRHPISGRIYCFYVLYSCGDKACQLRVIRIHKMATFRTTYHGHFILALFRYCHTSRTHNISNHQHGVIAPTILKHNVAIYNLARKEEWAYATLKGIAELAPGKGKSLAPVASSSSDGSNRGAFSTNAAAFSVAESSSEVASEESINCATALLILAVSSGCCWKQMPRTPVGAAMLQRRISLCVMYPASPERMLRRARNKFVNNFLLVFFGSKCTGVMLVFTWLWWYLLSFHVYVVLYLCHVLYFLHVVYICLLLVVDLLANLSFPDELSFLGRVAVSFRGDTLQARMGRDLVVTLVEEVAATSALGNSASTGAGRIGDLARSVLLLLWRPGACCETLAGTVSLVRTMRDPSGFRFKYICFIGDGAGEFPAGECISRYAAASFSRCSGVR